jgi:SAM-dependent methyltransferase
MKLNEWQTYWNELGKDDPLWVVLTDPSKKGGKWDPEEFFAIGAKEIREEVVDYLNSRGFKFERGVALDFGCGVGRLSQGLAEHFDRVHGIDISASMLEHARKFNRHGERVEYHLNSSNRLEAIADNSVDLIYSNIALQHIEPREQLGYIRDFVRVLRPGGVALFQVLEPTLGRRLFPQWLVDAYRRRKHGGQAFFGMFGVSERAVRLLLAEAGAEVLEVRRARFTWRWVNCWFCVRKKARA